MQEMKALSLWQPWGSLIMTGAKGNETRSRPTSIRGIIAIHAAKKVDVDAVKLLATEEFQNGLRPLLRPGMKAVIMEHLPRGAVIGTADLVDCVKVLGVITRRNPINGAPHLAAVLSNGREVCGKELAFGDYRPGRFVYVLRNAKPFKKPVPASGKQGFWNWTPPAPSEPEITEEEAAKAEIRIRMLQNVRPDLAFAAKPRTILRGGEEYPAMTNHNGAISGICESGEALGVRPGEFEFVSAPEWVLKIHRGIK